MGYCLPGTTYQQLVDAFGEPHVFDGDKTQAEWVLDINGHIATIYDYKEYSTAPEDVTDWHIGGFDVAVVALVHDIVKEPSQ